MGKDSNRIDINDNPTYKSPLLEIENEAKRIISEGLSEGFSGKVGSNRYNQVIANGLLGLISSNKEDNQGVINVVQNHFIMESSDEKFYEAAARLAEKDLNKWHEVRKKISENLDSHWYVQ